MSIKTNDLIPAGVGPRHPKREQRRFCSGGGEPDARRTGNERTDQLGPFHLHGMRPAEMKSFLERLPDGIGDAIEAVATKERTMSHPEVDQPVAVRRPLVWTFRAIGEDGE